MKILFHFATILLISKVYQKKSPKNKKEMRKLGSLDLEKIKKDILYSHNFYRRRHQVDDLKWNSEIEAIAQEYSEKIIFSSPLKRSSNTYKGESLGENLYVSKGGIGINGKEITYVWYNEVDNYDFSSHSSKNNQISSHFTQLVWKETKEIGCGATCFDTYCGCICNYYPAGNSIGLYDTNVFPYKKPIDGEMF